MASRAANFPLVSGSEGAKTNPSAGDLVADTGAITAAHGGGGIYEVLATVGGSAAASFSIQKRNTANSANVGTVFIVYTVASGSSMFPFRFNLELGERVRIVMTAALTGDANASITAQRVA